MLRRVAEKGRILNSLQKYILQGPRFFFQYPIAACGWEQYSWLRFSSYIYIYHFHLCKQHRHAIQSLGLITSCVLLLFFDIHRTHRPPLHDEKPWVSSDWLCCRDDRIVMKEEDQEELRVSAFITSCITSDQCDEKFVMNNYFTFHFNRTSVWGEKIGTIKSLKIDKRKRSVKFLFYIPQHCITKQTHMI